VPTQCSDRDFLFEPLPHRQVVARFDGGTITSDGGALLLAQVERRTAILRRLADCFTDHRDPEAIEHTVRQLVSQRVLGLALGYEDLNDHDILRTDPWLATLVGKADPTGQDRPRARDQGKPLAGKSTLNRLELTPADASAAQRYKKIVADGAAIDRLLVDVFLEAHATPPAQITLDLDSTDDPLHGRQEGRFFHGYYGGYCYLPLYIFCGEHLLAARLRTADHGDAAGVLEELPRVMAQIRAAWPGVRILVRGDSGFCREEIMAWCEANDVDYLFGLARNSRLEGMIERAMMDAHSRHLATGVAARVFVELR
jgi:Transposase DDE domain group 1